MVYKKLFHLLFLLFIGCTKQRHAPKQFPNPATLKIYIDPNSGLQIGYYDTLYSGEIWINALLKKN